jgi:hypothetical protein
MLTNLICLRSDTAERPAFVDVVNALNVATTLARSSAGMSAIKGSFTVNIDVDENADDANDGDVDEDDDDDDDDDDDEDDNAA